MVRTLLTWLALTYLLAAPAAAAAPGWAAGPAMVQGRTGHTMTLLANGKLLLAGGTDGEYARASAELFDPATNRWSETTSMKGDRHSHTATLLADGRVLVAGGYKGSPYNGTGATVATAQLYNPVTRTWADAASMASPRMGAAATLLQDGRVLVTGGAATPTAELYDPALNQWRPADDLLTARSGHTATLRPNGTVVIAGGSGTSGQLSTADAYDPLADRWELEENLTQPRASHAAVLLGNSVLVIGGFGASTYLASAQLIVPGTTWRPAGAMATPRAGAPAIILDDGRVLVMGGATTMNAKLSSAELYDPPRNVWSGAAAMTTARTGHEAVLLRDGRVLVSGGYTSAALFAVATTEVWTPSTVLTSPVTVDAGAQTVSGAGADAVIEVTNTGTSKALLGATTIEGPQRADFVVAADACSLAPIPPGQACRITVRFTPRGVGPRVAQMSFEANTATGRQSVRLTGTGATPPPTETPTPTPTAIATVAPTPMATPTPTPTPVPSTRVALPFRSRFSPPPGYSRAKACRGKVTLQLRAGSRVLATRTARLDRRCRYSTTFRIARADARGRSLLAVVVRFSGNRYLAPTRATYRVKVPTT